MKACVPADALVLVRLVDAHAVAEQAVAADVPEADLALDQRQRVLVVAAQRELEPAGADAVAPGVGQPSDGWSGTTIAHDPRCLHALCGARSGRAERTRATGPPPCSVVLC